MTLKEQLFRVVTQKYYCVIINIYINSISFQRMNVICRMIFYETRPLLCFNPITKVQEIHLALLGTELVLNILEVD